MDARSGQIARELLDHVSNFVYLRGSVLADIVSAAQVLRERNPNVEAPLLDRFIREPDAFRRDQDASGDEPKFIDLTDEVRATFLGP